MDARWEDAVRRGDVEAVQAQLRAGADVNARDRHGQTALMLAAHRGYDALVETLVAHGAELNVTAKYHLSALMLAVIAGHLDIARLLVRAGADQSIRGSGAPGFAGQTASDLAAARGMPALYDELAPE